jgi:hypothetical protein
VPQVATGSITYHWAKPTPEEVSRQIIKLSFELENLIEPMAVAGELARLDIQERFVEQNTPRGVPWKPWAISYEPDARAHNIGQILQRTTATQTAIGSRGAFIPTNQGLFIDTSGIPEWGIWNNFGAMRTSAAGGLTSEETRLSNLAFGREFERAPGVRLSGENQLFPRPFLGITDEAQYKMDAAFFAWFDGEVAFATSSLGKPFFRHAKRAGSGTFPSRFAPLD